MIACFKKIAAPVSRGGLVRTRSIRVPNTAKCIFISKVVVRVRGLKRFVLMISLAQSGTRMERVPTEVLLSAW